MRQIEVIYEKLSVEARGKDLGLLMNELIRKVHELDRDLHMEKGDRDEQYPMYVKIGISEVMYYLLMVASQHGACLECMSEIMENRLKFMKDKEAGISMVVPTPTVRNTDNTLVRDGSEEDN